MSIPLQLLCIYAFFVTARLIIISRSRRRIIQEVAAWKEEAAHWKGEADYWETNVRGWSDLAEKSTRAQEQAQEDRSEALRLVQTAVDQTATFAEMNDSILEQFTNASPHYSTSNGKLNLGPVLH